MLSIVSEPLDIPGLLQAVAHPECGASSLFLGTVRNHNLGKPVLYLEYEAYEPMALKEMKAIVAEAHQQWTLKQIGIVHRIGRLEIGETAVAIAVSSVHRKESIEAMHFTIDTLKQRVPIWKKEYWEDGSMWLENCCG